MKILETKAIPGGATYVTFEFEGAAYSAVGTFSSYLGEPTFTHIGKIVAGGKLGGLATSMRKLPKGPKLSRLTVALKAATSSIIVGA